MIKTYIDKKYRKRGPKGPNKNCYKEWNLGTKEQPIKKWLPIVVDAIRITDHVNFQELAEFLGGHLIVDGITWHIKPILREATIKPINPGDYIVKFEEGYCDAMNAHKFESLFREINPDEEDMEEE